MYSEFSVSKQSQAKQEASTYSIVLIFENQVSKYLIHNKRLFKMIKRMRHKDALQLQKERTEKFFNAIEFFRYLFDPVRARPFT
jgi:hypothetical protein